MTRRTNSRIAGITYLAYIVLGITQLMSSSGTKADAIAERLTLISQNATHERIDILLSLVIGFIAITLAVTLYGLTRDEDNELAVIGLVCRSAEGILGVLPFASLGLLWLATTQAGSDPASTHLLASFLVKISNWQVYIAALLFAVGSTFFSWLLLRGRMIPIPLAWLGVGASILLAIVLPLQLIGLFQGPLYQIIWIPMAAYEIPLGVWLIVKGAAPPARSAGVQP